MDSVVKQQVFVYGSFGFISGRDVVSVGTFDFYGLEKRFGVCIIIRGSGRTHALKCTTVCDLAPEI